MSAIQDMIDELEMLRARARESEDLKFKVNELEEKIENLRVAREELEVALAGQKKEGTVKFTTYTMQCPHCGGHFNLYAGRY